MWHTAITSEDINNYSICVIENGKVRSMSKFDDIDKQLVYVDNVPLDNMELTKVKIEKGKYVRYILIDVINKFTKQFIR